MSGVQCERCKLNVSDLHIILAEYITSTECFFAEIYSVQYACDMICMDNVSFNFIKILAILNNWVTNLALAIIGSWFLV